MSFLHPTLLAVGLASVAIPLIIHFFLRKRRKPVRWAAMRFLLEAYRKHQRRRKLEQILLLAMRCLLIALLAVGIARPIFGAHGESRATTLAIVIDNGVASGLVDRTGRTALSRHLEQAEGLIEGLNASRGDRVAVVSAAAPAEAIVATPTLDHAAALRALEGIAVRSSRADLADAIGIARGIVAGEGDSPTADAARAGEHDGRVAVLTGWRSGSLLTAADRSPGAGDDRGRAGGGLLLVSRPAESEVGNIRVTGVTLARDALFPTDTSAARQALVTVERDGPMLSAGVVNAVIETIGAGQVGGGGAREPFSVAFAPGERSVTVAVPLPADEREDADVAVRVRLTAMNAGIDAVPGDSAALRTLRLRARARIGIAHARRGGRPIGEFDSADWLRAALRPDDTTPITIREIGAPGLRQDDLAGLDAVFVTRPDLLPDAAWGDLARFVRTGGTVVLVPAGTKAAQQWPDRLESLTGSTLEVSREPIEFEDGQPLAVGPASAGSLPMLVGELGSLAGDATVGSLLAVDDAGAATVLATRSGRPVLVRVADRVWMFTAALELGWTDLPAKPLFVPLVQELARRSAGPSVPTTAVAGEALAVPAGAIELVSAKGERRVALMGGETVAPADSGVWSARDARGETLALVAVTPSPVGGRTDPTTEDGVVEWIGRAVPGAEPIWLGEGTGDGPAVSARPDDTRDWIPFVVALVFALFELVVARSASHAGMRTAGSGAA